jgi:hypothetical protein
MFFCIPPLRHLLLEGLAELQVQGNIASMEPAGCECAGQPAKEYTVQ